LVCVQRGRRGKINGQSEEKDRTSRSAGDDRKKLLMPAAVCKGGKKGTKQR